MVTQILSPIIDLLKPSGIETTSSAARIHYRWLVSAILVMGFVTTGFQLFGFFLNCEPGHEKSKEIVDSFCATTIPFITISNATDTNAINSVKYVFLKNTCGLCNKLFLFTALLLQLFLPSLSREFQTNLIVALLIHSSKIPSHPLKSN